MYQPYTAMIEVWYLSLQIFLGIRGEVDTSEGAAFDNRYLNQLHLMILKFEMYMYDVHIQA